MAKRRNLTTRAFGSEPGLPDVAGLAAWVSDHRGRVADIITYQLEASLSPQVSSEIGLPCAGGPFYADRIRQSIANIEDDKATGEIHAEVSAIIEDAAGIVVQKKGAWCAVPAPHVLGIRDAYYDDEEEWNGAIAGCYRMILRAMRDTGVAGNVLIADRMNGAELASLAGRKVFFFAPVPVREDLETLMEFQDQVAVQKTQLGMVFDLMNEYEVRKIFIIDPDPASISLALSHLDPDQVAAGGYCTESCGEYWKELVSSASYIA